MFAAGTDKHKLSCRIRILGRAEIPTYNGTGDQRGVSSSLTFNT